ncbi:MAG TPA: bacteriohemerythrin [Sideroxyarcus sp.]|nr:bacteriohemerythrin [Sideroxyarcus sp.]
MDSGNTQSGAVSIASTPVMVFAAVVFISLFIGNLLFDNLRDGIRREAQRDISAVGTLKANQIRDWLDDRLSDARTVSDNSFFSQEALLWMRAGGRNDARRRQLVERLEAFLKGHHFRTIVLYDAAGRQRLSAGQAIPDAEDMGEEARQTAASGQFRMVDMHRYRQGSPSIGLGFMSPLREGGNVAGAVYLVEDPERYLFPLVHYWPSGSETAETQLVRRDGDAVVFLDQLRQRSEPPMGFSLPLATPDLAAAIALRGKQGLLEHAHDYRGKVVLSYATAIEGTPWMLISKVDEDDAYRMVDQVRRVAAILALFIFVLIGAWGWQWLSREQAAADAAVLKERVRADALLMEGEKRFRTMFEHTALPIVRNALNGEFIEVNDAWCNMFGYGREEVLSQHLTWQQISHPDDVESSLVLVKKLLAQEIEDFRMEKRYIRKDGKVLWGVLQVSLVRDEHGAPEYFISAIQDITERKQVEQQISFMAYHDKLTGLPNRALFFDRLSQAMSQARRNGKHVALLYLDLDGFKPINDEFGHEAGDAVLRMVAQRLLACVRGVDTVARLGGDEFAVILGGLENPAEVENIAGKILQAFAQDMTLPDGTECNIGVSIGISLFPDDSNEMDRLLASADTAMYDSKHSGKNTYTFFGGDSVERPSRDEWIVFDSAHLIGVAEIDEEHRGLVKLLNRLNSAFNLGVEHHVIEQLFDDLLDATVMHFDTEHRLMAQYGYPQQALHEREHEALVRDALYLKGRLKDGGEVLALQSVKDWLLNHIHHSDKALGEYLARHGLH